MFSLFSTLHIRNKMTTQLTCLSQRFTFLLKKYITTRFSPQTKCLVNRYIEAPAQRTPLMFSVNNGNKMASLVQRYAAGENLSELIAIVLHLILARCNNRRRWGYKVLPKDDSVTEMLVIAQLLAASQPGKMVFTGCVYLNKARQRWLKVMRLPARRPTAQDRRVIRSTIFVGVASEIMTEQYP